MVNGKPATMDDLVQAVLTLGQQVGALKSQLAADEQKISQLETAVRAIGDRVGCGYEDLGSEEPLCPALP